ncbi:MAG: hypothetical protein R2856_08020 [Caldilineaceae bacterium]
MTSGAFGSPHLGAFDVTLTYGNDDDGRPFTTTVTLFDDNGGSASGTFRVARGNTNPTVDLTGPGAVNENPTLARTYNFTVTDTGIGSEVYSIVGSPSCGAGTLTSTDHRFQHRHRQLPVHLLRRAEQLSVNVEVSDGTVVRYHGLPVTVSNLQSRGSQRHRHHRRGHARRGGRCWVMTATSSPRTR